VSNWREVRKGFVVEDKTGQQWTVLGREPGQVFTLSAPGRTTYTGPFQGDVVIVKQPTPQEDPHVQDVVARGLIATKFGGVEVGKQGKDKTQPWMNPVEFTDPGAMLAHLRIFHNALSDDPTLAGLVKHHGTLHHPKQKVADLYEPHVHTPDFDEL
jgi:hypothetical protein